MAQRRMADRGYIDYYDALRIYVLPVRQVAKDRSWRPRGRSLSIG